ncbi:hypothetical protein [Nonomuraea zeae]|uniref:Uncharacterized protein n=1 Tax=Nonomuraea zeae TaxID=1642303 RepID=A0A5S4F8P1_9ACTN|nr:hypothetical protein [Nonomuraea zeae]TMR13048.1 hypothetical protein ETD85_57885 [Nonomuraea zeae]
MIRSPLSSGALPATMLPATITAAPPTARPFDGKRRERARRRLPVDSGRPIPDRDFWDQDRAASSMAGNAASGRDPSANSRRRPPEEVIEMRTTRVVVVRPKPARPRPGIDLRTPSGRALPY